MSIMVLEWLVFLLLFDFIMELINFLIQFIIFKHLKSLKNELNF